MEMETGQDLMMLIGAYYIPKHNPSKPLGDDAYFFSHEAQVMGVADGVGGWARKGIDAGKYSRLLMRNAEDSVEDCRPHDVDPMRLLVESFMNTTEVEGSSTACIVSLAGDLLRAANLGDSGFMVIRGGKTFYKTEAQQHSFNYPYQIGWRHSTNIGSPEEAEDIVLGVEVGDVIVLGTDGLFDNVFEEDIEKIVGLCLEKNDPPEIMARKLAGTAVKNSLEDKTTPFEVAAYDAGVGHFGGKYDDVTVLVACVCDSIFGI
ncbi:Serine/threonine protein phosphatase [Handroanthus impetiginosus]|uniref:Protein phosphatase n=1 Tax=Handroanthus impetiginosus TaxID=429701 RepID=A0A2G9HUN8_9LAMI|nr:Serine/threonine protein phosphatase [Handroanthus impetiginosus]